MARGEPSVIAPTQVSEHADPRRSTVELAPSGGAAAFITVYLNDAATTRPMESQMLAGRSICLQERPHMTHRQGNQIRRLFPGVEAYLGVRREPGRLHRHRVRMRWDVVRQH